MGTRAQIIILDKNEKPWPVKVYAHGGDPLGIICLRLFHEERRAARQ